MNVFCLDGPMAGKSINVQDGINRLHVPVMETGLTWCATPRPLPPTRLDFKTVDYSLEKMTMPLGRWFRATTRLGIVGDIRLINCEDVIRKYGRDLLWTIQMRWKPDFLKDFCGWLSWTMVFQDTPFCPEVEIEKDEFRYSMARLGRLEFDSNSPRPMPAWVERLVRNRAIAAV